ncbi:MAG TPA: transaldolase, partial [Steroidobacteraceae bacterium]|nr:transaldolase [Steroidobacteraceae bacterium]
MASSRLTRLAELGQSAWLDDLSRDLLESGKLEQLVRDGVRGVTSNPATFEKAISRGTAYDGQLREGARAGLSTSQLYRELTTRDVRNACDLLRPVYDTTSGLDGYVSLEVSPHLAHDAEASISEARELAAAVDRPNLMVKIPGTEAGLIAIEELLFRGINVNVTLLFSIDRYRAVLESYLKALERRLEAGSSVRDVASVASFFLSRIDVLVDELLAHRMQPGGESPLEPHPAELRGQAAVANAKAAHAVLRRSLRGERWQALDRDGARVQRLLWASTGTKDPRYSDVKYVEPLIGPHTVTTMPLATLEAFEDHGTVKTTLGKQDTAARGTIRDLRELGIDLRQVAWQLENEGVQKFIVPFDRSLKDIEAKRAPCAAQQDLDGLEARALQLRRDVITMTTAAGSGHPSSCLSAADLVAALYFAQMRWDPAVPEARDVDTFMLSKGHAAPLLWAALHRAGAIDEDIATLRKLDSTLEGHPTPANPWVK